MNDKYDEQKYKDELYERAKKVTPEGMTEFIQELVSHDHNYGSCVIDVAAAAIAGASIMSRELGITGFQAGCVLWEYLEQFHHIKFPTRLLQQDDMLFPQYESKFTTITKEVWDWLQKEAKERLSSAGEEENYMHPNVRRHMQSIIDGQVPFGYKVQG